MLVQSVAMQTHGFYVPRGMQAPNARSRVGMGGYTQWKQEKIISYLLRLDLVACDSRLEHS